VAQGEPRAARGADGAREGALTVAAPYTGRCLCGAVEYRLNEEPVMFYACHCTDCQKRSGSSFGLSMWVKRAALEVTRGDAMLQVLAGADGGPRHQRMCAKCGTRLWSEPARRPELAVLRPGTLDNAKEWVPAAHIWTRSAQPWVTIPEGVARYEKQPEEFAELARLWRERRE
jgi:hypothetical protein